MSNEEDKPTFTKEELDFYRKIIKPLDRKDIKIFFYHQIQTNRGLDLDQNQWYEQFTDHMKHTFPDISEEDMAFALLEYDAWYQICTQITRDQLPSLSIAHVDFDRLDHVCKIRDTNAPKRKIRREKESQRQKEHQEWLAEHNRNREHRKYDEAVNRFFKEYGLDKLTTISKEQLNSDKYENDADFIALKESIIKLKLEN